MPTPRAEMAPEPETIEAAAARLADLEVKHALAIAKAGTLAAERSEIAFDAHAGAPRMRARLDAINLQLATQGSEVDGLAAAVNVAKARLLAAQAHAARAGERERAARVVEIAGRFREHGAAMEAAIATLLAAHGAFLADAGELNRLGEAWPSLHMATLGTRRAFAAALMGSKLQLEHLAPNERHKIGDLLGGWAAGIEAKAGPVLAAREAA